MTNLTETIVGKLNTIIKENNLTEICDFGAGDGEILSLLKESNPELNCTGIDFYSKYPAMKEKALQRKEVLFLDKEEISDLTEKFDLVFSTFALHHYQYPVKTLKEISNITKNEGFIATIDFLFKNKTNGEIIKNVSSFIEEMGAAIKGNYHRHHYTLKEAEDLLSLIPGKIVNSEEFECLEEESEIKNQQESRLNRNELIRKNIGKAPEFWQKLWIPLFEQEHKLLKKFGHDYSSLFMTVVKVKKNNH